MEEQEEVKPQVTEELIARLENANKIKEELLSREEENLRRKAIGGKAEAGIIPEKPKELTPEEYANAFMKGEVNILE